jgi:hypothetical protein
MASSAHGRSNHWEGSAESLASLRSCYLKWLPKAALLASLGLANRSEPHFIDSTLTQDSKTVFGAPSARPPHSSRLLSPSGGHAARNAAGDALRRVSHFLLHAHVYQRQSGLAQQVADSVLQQTHDGRPWAIEESCRVENFHNGSEHTR